ncbi:MAG: ribonuclease H family protein [Fibrobacteria bacterium]
MAKKNFYAAVFQDGANRIYSNWPDCQRATRGVPNIQFKGFATRDEAQAWIALTIPSEASLSLRETSASGPSGHPSAYPSGTVLIYVDGSYIHAKCKRAGWAWLAVRDGEIVAKESGVTSKDALSRNIDGELEASIHAMEWAHRNGHRAVIHHDYTGIAMWATGAWKVKAEVSLGYVDRIRDIKDGIRFQKVEGHSGDKFNDMVDQMAAEAITAFIESRTGNGPSPTDQRVQ